MINYDGILEEDIAGLSTEELDFVTRQTAGRQKDSAISQYNGLPILESSSIDQFLSTMTEFPELNEADLLTIERLEKDSAVHSTERQTTIYIERFKEFLAERSLSTDLEVMPTRYLCSYLRLFFSTVKKADGSAYSCSTLVCMRAAVHRFMLARRQMPIIGNVEFVEFEKTFKAALTYSLKQPVSVVDGQAGFRAIEKGDMEKLHAYFDRASPMALQREVFFIIVYHFGLRGREWIRSLSKDDIVVRYSEGGEVECVDLIKVTEMWESAKKDIEEQRGCELPGFDNVYPVVERLVRNRFLKLVREPSSAFLVSVNQEVDETVRNLADLVFSDYPSFNQFIKEVCEGIRTGQVDLAREQIKNIFIEEEFVFTQDRIFLLEKDKPYNENLRLPHHKHESEGKREGQISSEQPATTMQDIVQRNTQRVLEGAEAYIRVAVRRLQDTITLAVMHYMLHKMSEKLRESLIVLVTDPQPLFDKLREENPLISARRRYLADRMEKLAAAEQELARF